MAKKKSKLQKLSERAIRNMTYESRQANYNREKQEHYQEWAGLSPYEFDRKIKDLADKWGV